VLQYIAPLEERHTKGLVCVSRKVASSPSHARAVDKKAPIFRAASHDRGEGEWRLLVSLLSRCGLLTFVDLSPDKLGPQNLEKDL